MHKNKNIKYILLNGLCTGCGTCSTICPTNSIEIIKDELKGVYIPKINEKLCTQCELCLKVCPGYAVDFYTLNQHIFSKQPNDIWLGNYLSLYIGQAADYEIRYNASSGGVITALLIFALREGIIDGALVTTMSKSNPLEPEIIIARSKKEIISAMGSKYCPVPLNVGLRNILENDGKFAVVGLPCHIHGIRKFEIINKILRNKIVLHLGLMCCNNSTFLGTEYYLGKKGIKIDEIKSLKL